MQVKREEFAKLNQQNASISSLLSKITRRSAAILQLRSCEKQYVRNICYIFYVNLIYFF